MQGPQLAVEVRIPSATAVIVLDDFFESRNAAIMHIRRSSCYLTQRRRFKSPLPGALIGQPVTFPRYTSVVRLLIGEVRPRMTGYAVRFTAEQLQPRLLLRGERI